ncbi:MAG: hypothetical protein N2235_05185 [Fischerella sp.]|nr:hypothetical protein [Fischerella sp.]
MEVKIGDYPPEEDPLAQREISIKIDRWDTWSLDHTLALIILPALKEFRKNIRGYPSCFSNSVGGNEDWDPQLNFDFYQETAKDYSKVPAELWAKTIDKMIWSFEHIAGKYSQNLSEPDKNWEDFYIITPSVVKEGKTIEDMFIPVDPENVEEGYTLSDDYYEQQRVDDWEGRKRHEEMIQEGLNLFAKYYQNLWN